jgi:hypothetical protein
MPVLGFVGIALVSFAAGWLAGTMLIGQPVDLTRALFLAHGIPRLRLAPACVATDRARGDGQSQPTGTAAAVGRHGGGGTPPETKRRGATQLSPD